MEALINPPLTSEDVHCRLASRLQATDGKSTLLGADDGADSYLPARAPLLASLEFEHAILHLLASDGPLGSGTLMERLQELGYRGSEPTVGRFLRTLDRRGLSSRISNKGRDLTEHGRTRLRELCEAEDQLFYERELIRTMRSNTIDDLLDVLVARRALEREAARLAADHASREDVEQIEAAIAEHRRVLTTSGVPIDADVKVHRLIAQAGQNRVLAAAIDLIRRDKQLTIALDAILKLTDHKWVVGHERILRAIKRRAADEAERAMLEHIDTLIADVRRYRDSIDPPRLPTKVESPRSA
jgi:GntR family L-lactate dehydrogenase operon transcriptional regulator